MKSKVRELIRQDIIARCKWTGTDPSVQLIRFDVEFDRTNAVEATKIYLAEIASPDVVVKSLID